MEHEAVETAAPRHPELARLTDTLFVHTILALAIPWLAGLLLSSLHPADTPQMFVAPSGARASWWLLPYIFNWPWIGMLTLAVMPTLPAPWAPTMSAAKVWKRSRAMARVVPWCGVFLATPEGLIPRAGDVLYPVGFGLWFFFTCTGCAWMREEVSVGMTDRERFIAGLWYPFSTLAVLLFHTFVIRSHLGH